MRKAALFVVWMMVAALAVVATPSPAPGVPNPGVVLGQADFSGFSHGANIHAEVVRAGAAPGPTVADVEAAFSGAAVDSDDFDAGVPNEANVAIVPTPGAPDVLVDSGDKETYGKGSGLEVGLGTGLPNDDLNQLVLGGRAEAGAQPAERSDGDPPLSATDTGLVQTSLAEVPGEPLIYAQALLAEAQARWNATNCILGDNLAFGRGQVAQAQLVEAAGDDTTPNFDAPLVSVDADFFGSENRAAADSQSFSYFVPNPDGSFGLATETHMTFAPIELLRADPTLPAPVTIEILGEWVFRAVATGKPGGASISYEVVGPSEDPDTPIIRIWLGAAATDNPTIEIKRGQLFTDEGINIPAGPLLDLTIGEDPRAIVAPNLTPDPTSQPTEAADGTEASGAADLIRLDLLSPSPIPGPAGPEVVGLKIGHLEASAQVPVDGINCPGSVRIDKDAPDDAQDQDFTFTVDCDDNAPDRTATITGDGSAQIDLIPSGSICTVHEDSVNGFIDQDDQDVGPVVTNGIHDVQFVNERVPPPPGTLIVRKDAPDDAQDQEFRFTIDCPEVFNTPFRREITGDGDSAPVTVDPGNSECTVSEFTEDGFVSQPAQTVLVPPDTTVIVTFTNERVQPGQGSLVVFKDAPDDAQDVTFTFRISCPALNNEPFDRRVTGDGFTEPVAGIPADTVCTVHEDPLKEFVVQADQDKTIVGDQENTVTFVNTRTASPPGGGGEVLTGGEVQTGTGGEVLTGGEPQQGAAVQGATFTNPSPGPSSEVRGVQITRPASTAATPVQAQPRFTG